MDAEERGLKIEATVGDNAQNVAIGEHINQANDYYQYSERKTVAAAQLAAAQATLAEHPHTRTVRDNLAALVEAMGDAR